MEHGQEYQLEQIIAKPRETEVLLGKDQTLQVIVREMGITEQTYYRWRKATGACR